MSHTSVSPIVIDNLETLGIDVVGLRPEKPPRNPSQFSPMLKRHLEAIGIYGGSTPHTPGKEKGEVPKEGALAYPGNVIREPIPEEVVKDLFFLGGKVHEIAEGNPDEHIQFIQKVLGGDPPYPDQYSDDTLYEMDEDEFTTLYLRAKRVVYCGRPWRWPIGANGVPYLMTFACGVWRACPRCREARVDKWRGRTLSALMEKREATGNGTLWVIHTADLFSARVIKTILGRKRYLCFPTKKSVVIVTDDDNDEVHDLISSTYHTVDVEVMAYDDLTNVDWEALTNTPERRRISGSLGKPKKVDDGRTPITSYSLVIKGIGCVPEQDEIVRAYTEASEKVTAKHDPTTKSELEDALFQIAMRWKDALERNARQNDKRFQVFVSEITIRADLTRIGLEDPIRAKYRLEENILARWHDLEEPGG